MGGWGGRRIEAASSVPGTGLALSPQVSMDRTLQSRGWVVWCRLLTIVSRVFSHGPKASPTWSQPKALSKSPNPSSPSFCQPADSSSQATQICLSQEVVASIRSHLLQPLPLKPPLGLPGWFTDKESACQCRRQGFRPWLGKIPHAAVTGPGCQGC